MITNIVRETERLAWLKTLDDGHGVSDKDEGNDYEYNFGYMLLRVNFHGME